MLSQLDIARLAHEVNRAYCEAIGDTSIKPWPQAEEWQKASAIAGVQFHQTHPEATPESSHERWMEHKAADGWTLGPTKDPIAKTHPAMVAYDKLPAEQRVKDYLFRGVVHACLEINQEQ